MRAVRMLLAAVAAAVSAAPLAAQTARFEGSITDSLGHPIPDVRIRVVRLPSAEAVTDSAGEFRIVDLAAGLTVVSVRRIGYRPGDFVVKLADDSVSVVTIILAPVTIALDTIHVRGERVTSQGLALVGFFDRQAHRVGSGTFFGPDSIAALHPSRPSDLMRQVAGVRLEQQNGAAIMYGPNMCLMAVWIDGHFVNPMIYVGGAPMDNTATGMSSPSMLRRSDGLDSFVNSSEIAAMEIYPRESEVPAQYHSDRTVRCGAILIWTK